MQVLNLIITVPEVVPARMPLECIMHTTKARYEFIKLFSADPSFIGYRFILVWHYILSLLFGLKEGQMDL